MNVVKGVHNKVYAFLIITIYRRIGHYTIAQIFAYYIV